MSQLLLFKEIASRPVEPCDPSVPPEAKPRLSRQCGAVLERLRFGPATNTELGSSPERYGLNYRARISDLRKAGYAIRCCEESKETGKSWYRLESP